MAELKKCPFCGSDKLKIDSKSGQIHYYQKNGMNPWQHVVFSVRCNKCNARGGAVGADLPTNILGDFVAKKAEVEQKAIEAWNNRATEAEIRAKVIDEFAEKLGEAFAKATIGFDAKFGKVLYAHEDGKWHDLVKDLAEQLKEE